MKKAFGMVEILIVLAVFSVIFLCTHQQKFGRSNPFSDTTKIEEQQNIVNDKISDIEDAKALRTRIEQNLNKGY